MSVYSRMKGGSPIGGYAQKSAVVTGKVGAYCRLLDIHWCVIIWKKDVVEGVSSEIPSLSVKVKFKCVYDDFFWFLIGSTIRAHD